MAAIYLSSIINIHQNGKRHTGQGIGQQENHNILPFVLRPEIRKKKYLNYVNHTSIEIVELQE